MDNGGMTERDDAFFRDQNQKENNRTIHSLAKAVLWFYEEKIGLNDKVPFEIAEAILIAKRIGS